jgi:hypothetical protein
MSSGTHARDGIATSASKLPERRQDQDVSTPFVGRITKCCCDPRASSGWCQEPAQAYPAIPHFSVVPLVSRKSRERGRTLPAGKATG